MYAELVRLGAKDFVDRYPADFELKIAGVVRRANKGFFLEHDPAQSDKDNWRRGFRRIHCLRETEFRTGQQVIVIGSIRVSEVEGVPRIVLVATRVLPRQ